MRCGEAKKLSQERGNPPPEYAGASLLKTIPAFPPDDGDEGRGRFPLGL